jgi:ATP-dependent Clp protease ATP-binding subunit ClpA
VLGSDVVHRVDEVVVFEPLEPADVERLVDLFLRDIAGVLAERGIAFAVTGEARAWLAGKGYDAEHGARLLRQAMHEHAIGPIVDGLVAGRYVAGQALRLDGDGSDGVTLTAGPDAGAGARVAVGEAV